MAEIEWVLLREFADASGAKMFGEFLGQQGIPASVEGSFATGVLPGITATRVMVPADRIEEARQAAEAFDGDSHA